MINLDSVKIRLSLLANYLKELSAIDEFQSEEILIDAYK